MVTDLRWRSGLEYRDLTMPVIDCLLIALAYTPAFPSLYN